MLFNSYSFFIFFPMALAGYFFLKNFKARALFLLAASYYFYMVWRPKYIILLLVSTLISYASGFWMSKCADKKDRKKYLILSIIVNVGILFFFKYYLFFAETIEPLIALPLWRILLPVGISFYTFQTLSYCIDVYKGEIRAERSFVNFALYVAFFPQLVAGPIERASHLLPQIRLKHSFDYARILSGLQLAAWGFFKKTVIADRLAVYVNGVYGDTSIHGIPLILATYFFAFQIYCDFSGYSDIAIGTARMFGFDIMQNFNAPFFAKSIRDFWRRWHISLSSWFRDYVYIPLGGNKTSRSKWYRNILLVFLITGFWHGARWTFIVWGIVHGVYMVCAHLRGQLTQRFMARLRIMEGSLPLSLIQIIITFHLVLIGWVFFRAESVTRALGVFKGMMRIDRLHFLIPGIRAVDLIIPLIGMGVLLIVEWAQQRKPIVARVPASVRLAVCLVFALAILFFGKMHAQSFIYFQF